MTITIEIPKELLDEFVPAGQDPARAVLEAIALEGYRSDRLSESDVRELLGFETRMEVDGFLKEHGAFMHYTIEDLEHDIAVRAKSRIGHRPSAAATCPASGVPDDRRCRHRSDRQCCNL